MSDSVFYDDPIRLIYFSSWPNFGDRLSRSLIEYLTGRGIVQANREDGELMAVGSLLREDLMFGEENCEIQDNESDMNIWGSGFWNPKIIEGRMYYPKRRMNIYALRGRLSLDIFKRLGYVSKEFECAFGDPGILFPELVDLTSAKRDSYEVALVPHKLDKEEFKNLYDAFVAAGVDVRYINVTQNDSFSVIRQMAGAKRVLSSSLHGVILADALHIPNRRIKSDIYEQDQRHINSISDFKFADYYSAYGMEAPDSIRVNTLLQNPLMVYELVGDDDFVLPKLVEAQKQELLSSFPYELYSADSRTVLESQLSPVLTVIIICEEKDEYYLHSAIMSAVRRVDNLSVEVLCIEGKHHSRFADNLLRYYQNIKFLQIDNSLCIKERLRLATNNISGRFVIVTEASDMIDIVKISNVCSNGFEVYNASKGWINDDGEIAVKENKQQEAIFEDDSTWEKNFLGTLFPIGLFKGMLSATNEAGLTFLKDGFQNDGEKIVFHRLKSHLE